MPSTTSMKSPVVLGVGCTSLITVTSEYAIWTKKVSKPPVPHAYVPPGGHLEPNVKGVPRLVLFDGVTTLQASINSLHGMDRVLLSDSPLLLNEIPVIQVLDMGFDIRTPWAYNITGFKAATLHSAVTKDGKKPYDWPSLKWERVNQLGLVIDETSTGKLVSPIKSITAQLSPAERKRFRKLMGDWSTGKETLQTVTRWLTSTLGKTATAASLTTALTTPAKGLESTLRPLLAVMATGKSPKKALEAAGISMFEAKFLFKMSKE